MKKLLLLLLLPSFAHCQSLEFKQYFTIEPQVVEVDTTSADELYNRLKSWVIKSYNEPNEVIVVDTPKQIRIRPLDSCFMTYKPLLTVICYVVRYQIALEIKDNKYRFGTYHSYGRGRDYVIYRDKFGNPFKVRLPKNDPGGEHE